MHCTTFCLLSFLDGRRARSFPATHPPPTPPNHWKVLRCGHQPHDRRPGRHRQLEPAPAAVSSRPPPGLSVDKTRLLVYPLDCTGGKEIVRSAGRGVE